MCKYWRIRKKLYIFAAILLDFILEMGKFSLYNIPLKSLSTGKHEFKFTLDNKFFELIDDGTADVKRGSIDVLVSVKRTSVTFDFDFEISGKVFVPCDRCLDDIKMDVLTNNRLIVKFGAEYSEESDEIVIIPEEEGEINIAWFLYEFVVLSLPAKKVHPPGSCNKVMSSKLNKHKVSSTGDEEDMDDLDGDDMEDDVADSDSRWDALKDTSIDGD